MAHEVTDQAGELLDYLPEIYREDPFLGQYLSAFEKVLLRYPPKAAGLGLEQKIARVAEYFDPMLTPPEFLEWLSGWVALSLRADLDEVHQREFIRDAVRLYHLRGTKKGLEELVSIYTRLGASITDAAMPLRVESESGSRVGVNTLVEGGTPFVFRVLINLSTTVPSEIKKHREVVTAILNMEKPSHTLFLLEVETPVLRIEDYSRVEVNTLLGEPPAD
ncbi:MAG TPA: phage tail protein [Pyrinomonadaceae bacterium]|nr:phage tail protein [Pyrinomonadaceae bacterium]